MITVKRFLPPRRLVGAFVLLSLTLLASCLGVEETKNSRGVQPMHRQPVLQSFSSSLQNAQAALARGDYARAELLAQKLTGVRGSSREEQAEALQLYAQAASKNKHPYASLNALDRWRQLSQGADGSLPWQEIWSASMRQVPAREAKAKAEAVLAETEKSIVQHNLALVFLLTQEWRQEATVDSLKLLESAYAASSPAEKGLLEHALLRELRETASPALQNTLPLISDENKLLFPYCLMRIAEIQRSAQSPEERSAAQGVSRTLAAECRLADPAAVDLGFVSHPAVAASPDSHGQKKIVALVLPLSSPFGTISAKIVAGAKVAAEDSSISGVVASLQVIDTDQADWLSQAAALPAECELVGGPLRSSDYVALKKSGLLRDRAFFAFMPSLDGADEGRSAWRFFNSPEDQARALVDFTTRLGIKGYAVLYPSESFGERMAALFERRVQAAGGSLDARVSYNPVSPGTWLRSLAGLFSSSKNLQTAVTAPYEAIFLPDSWKNMEILIPALFQYGGEKQVLLGTNLWEQALALRGPLDPGKYKLAVFPGSWNPAGDSPDLLRLRTGLKGAGIEQVEFWHGLGYDFVRFATAFQISRTFSPESVNRSLQEFAFNWTLAPIFWSPNGQAGQNMILLTPSEKGYRQIDERIFTELFRANWGQ